MNFEAGERGRAAGSTGGNGTFEHIVEEHWTRVARLAYHLCGNVHDAEDLAQETFLRAMSRVDQFQAGTCMRAWLCRIATNAYLDRQRRRTEANGLQPAAHRAPGDADVLSGVARVELHDTIRGAIDELPDQHRVAFVLRTGEGMSFREIAEILGTSEAGARWHLFQARQDLMKKLDGRV